MNKLIEILRKDPIAYEVTEQAFWDDDHISQSMLQAHLDTKEDVASRNHAYIDASVLWIDKLTQEKNY